MINHIAKVSIVAMAAPVAALVVLMSVFNGLEAMVSRLYRAIDADISITAQEGTTFPIEKLDTCSMRQTEGVESLSLSLEQGALAKRGDRMSIINLRGVESNYPSTLPIEELMVVGEFDTEGDNVVAANGVLNDLGYSQLTQHDLGEQLSIYAIDRTRFSTLLPVGGYSHRELSLSGAYNIDEDNSHVAITSLATAQRLMRYDGRASKCDIKLSPDAQPKFVAEALQQIAGEEFRVLTRFQSNSLYRLMALEKWGVFGVAALILLIASLSIVGTLVMMIIDKREDMATLRTMGCDEPMLRKIFICEGMLMASLSGVVGVVVGIALTLAQQHLGLIRLNAVSLSIDAYPVELRLTDVGATVVAYVVIAYAVVRSTVRAMIKQNS